jgi:hypothetical protein
MQVGYFPSLFLNFFFGWNLKKKFISQTKYSAQSSVSDYGFVELNK